MNLIIITWSTLSYNLNELVGGGTTQILGLSTSIGVGSSTSALVHIGAATTLGGSSQGGGEVIVATVGTASTTGILQQVDLMNST